jgi:hypothetical protein
VDLSEVDRRRPTTPVQQFPARGRVINQIACPVTLPRNRLPAATLARAIAGGSAAGPTFALRSWACADRTRLDGCMGEVRRNPRVSSPPMGAVPHPRETAEHRRNPHSAPMHPSVGVEIAREGILEVLTAVALEVLVAAPDGLVSLAARYLEQNGIATVVMGCAKDIVEFVGVPRFLFSDFPLGNAAGRPRDPQSQAFTLELALRVLETAPAARTTVQSPLRWSADSSWRLDYSNIERLSAEEIQRRREEFDRQKEIAREIRDQRAAES